MAATVKLRLRVPSQRVYVSRITKRDEYGTVVDDRVLTPNSRATSSTQQDMPPRARRGASAEPQKRSIRLTVKAPPSRLQEIKGDDEDTRRSSRARSGRSVRNLRRSYVDKGSSAEEEDDDEEEEDAEGEADEQDEDEDEEDEEEDEEEDDAEGDVDMEDAPPPPPKPVKQTIKFSTSKPTTAPRGRKASPTTTLNLAGTKHRTVEEKETGDADSQSSSSEVEDDPEDLENGALDEPDDLDRGDTIKVDAINESDLDSDDSSGLPDLSNLTRRQRGGGDDGALMALSNEAQKKKFFTAEQITMRRAEMARRRKDLSEKRNEQEKADTLRRLLEKPAPTRRSRAQVLADAEREEFGPGRAGLRGESVLGDNEEGEPEPRANRIYTRTIIGRDVSKLGVPADWLEGPAGSMFEKTSRGEGWTEVVRSGRMVEEVQ